MLIMATNNFIWSLIILYVTKMCKEFIHEAGFPAAYPSWESDPIDMFESSPTSDLSNCEIWDPAQNVKQERNWNEN